MADPIKVKKKKKKETPEERKLRIQAENKKKAEESEAYKKEQKRKREAAAGVQKTINEVKGDVLEDYQESRDPETKAELDEVKAMDKDNSLFSTAVVGVKGAQKRQSIRVKRKKK